MVRFFLIRPSIYILMWWLPPKKLHKNPNLEGKLQKVRILVSRISDIFWRKSGHLQIVAVNPNVFDIKGYNTVDLWHSWLQMTFVQFHASYKGKIQRILSLYIFLLKIWRPAKKSLFASLGKVCCLPLPADSLFW